jgi:hypothetical protein
MQAGFNLLPPISDEKTITIPATTVRIVPPGTVPKVSTGRCKKSGVIGCASRWAVVVEGRESGGKIVVNQAVLGHEFNHLLNFGDSNIADPDRLEQ